MAKVLLINSNRFMHPWPVIPFGLCYIATALETNGNHPIADYIMKVSRSRQPVWRLLIFLKRVERFFGIALLKRGLYELKKRSGDKKGHINNGFSLIRKKVRSNT
jgi:hypothetical protein